MTITIPIIASNGALSTITVANPTVTTGSSRGLITSFIPASDNWQEPGNIVIDGQQFFAEHGNKAWSLTKLDNYTIRFELRPGDEWADDETARSEILTVTNAEDGSIFKASYNMTVEPGTINSLDWLAAGQMHEDGGIPFSVSLLNDRMNILTDQNADWGTQPYVDPNLLVRGHSYAMQFEAKFSNSTDGYLKVWRDGVQIVNYTGRLGSETNGQYMKIGIYAGYPSRVTSTIAIKYDHITFDFQAPPPPPPPPPLPPGINKVGIQTVGSIVDDGNAGEILAQRVDLGTAATLQSLSFYLGTAGGNIRLGVYNTVNGRPGTKVAETASSTAAVGWNTKAVLTQVVLQPGTYWLAFELSSNAARSRLIGSGSLAWSGQTYGTLPTTFPGSNTLANDSWSYYMTVNV